MRQPFSEEAQLYALDVRLLRSPRVPAGSPLAAALPQPTTGVPPAPIPSATPQPKPLPAIFQKMITGSFG